MKVREFEEIIGWQKARSLNKKIYCLFSGNRDYGFKDQIQRASVSIMNNIAEGFERNTDKEFKHFLYIAKGSCAEVRSMLYLAHDLEYLDKNQFDELSEECKDIAKLISGFIKTL